MNNTDGGGNGDYVKRDVSDLEKELKRLLDNLYLTNGELVAAIDAGLKLLDPSRKQMREDDKEELKRKLLALQISSCRIPPGCKSPL